MAISEDVHALLKHVNDTAALVQASREKERRLQEETQAALMQIREHLTQLGNELRPHVLNPHFYPVAGELSPSVYITGDPDGSTKLYFGHLSIEFLPTLQYRVEMRRTPGPFKQWVTHLSREAIRGLVLREIADAVRSGAPLGEN